MRGFATGTRKLGNFLRETLRAEAGATAIEYGIIAGIIALGIVAGAEFAGHGIDRLFQVIGISLEAATNAAAGTVGN